MSWSIDVSPILPLWAVAALAVPALLLALALLAARARGAVLRVLAVGALALALLNPVILREDREPLSSVVALVVDRSQSQSIEDRTAQTETALAALRAELAEHPEFEVRVVEARSDAGGDADRTTALFSALDTALRDVSPARVGGAVMITDGQVHDVPANAEALGFDAPVHGLVTGREDEFDRRIEVVSSPRFGVVGEEQSLAFRVVEEGAGATQTPVEVRAYLNGELLTRLPATPGEETQLPFQLPRAGESILELSVASRPDEITGINNRAIALVDGIRENLRVLLVSGEPHAGERTWRNLLKSDAAVDLVHFTILRPPEKQDGTPIDELSLIAFPTRELFVERIDDFDLIIFDRYQRRGVLPTLYYDYIAQYVTNGGAVLVASGPEYAGPDSIASSPLASVLPALPTGGVDERAFRPMLSDLGRRHPVTRDLPGAEATPADWSPWFRSIDVGTTQGETVMEGPDGKPLLVLDRAGEGRVALLLSDHGWLWSRGFAGGGPHVPLFRRLAHWLMQEPELEEEALRASAEGAQLTVVRTTLGEDPGPATIITPSGGTLSLALSDAGDGEWTGTSPADELGLYQIANGDLSTLVNVGPVNPREYREAISTPDLLAPIAEGSGGSVRRLGADAEVPAVRPVSGRSAASGSNFIGLRQTQESLLVGIDRTPLFAGFLGLAGLLLAVSATWWREGR